MTYAPNFGTLLRALLKKHSLSMRKLSKRTGIDTATISRIVNGKQQAKLSHLTQFADHLNISLEKLVEASGMGICMKQGNAEANIHDSVDAIQETLRSSEVFVEQFSTERIRMELAKYEQYAQTEEGNRIICEEFYQKVEQINGTGPFIEELKKMHIQYCNDSISNTTRAVLGSGLLYFILSVDIIPDYVFPIGYLDDAIAVQIVLDRLSTMNI